MAALISLPFVALSGRQGLNAQDGAGFCAIEEQVIHMQREQVYGGMQDLTCKKSIQKS